MEYIKTNIDNDSIRNKTIKIKPVEYLYYDYIDINVGDPISAITLTNRFVIIGTMTGGIKLYYFNEKRIYIISKSNIENISGLSYSVKDHILYACVGDVHYLKYEMKEPFMNYSMPFSIIDLYPNNSMHNYSCENSYTLTSPNSILKINIFVPELQEKIDDDSYINYEITSLKKNVNSYTNPKSGRLKCTNFYVPLDFNGKYFCWVEYLNAKKERNILIQNVSLEQTSESIDNRLPINEKYGHVSHVKLLKGNKVLIIHNLNECQIYEINQHFDEVENFTHLGDEVYSVDVVYGYNELSKSYNRNSFLRINNNSIGADCGTSNKIRESENQRLKEKDKEKEKKLKNLKSSNSEAKMDAINFIKLNLYNNRNEDYNLNYSIITLDIDGNVNKYENKQEVKLFNLYEINGIHQDFKDKKFFNMGYMYFIKTNLEFFCITTDHGCFIIKKSQT